MRVENEQLEEMLVAQNELNSKYTTDWRADVKSEEIFTAIFTEVAEFLESSPQEWKWWKRKYLDNDKQNQYIETVDVIHFGLTYLLFDKSVEEILEENGTVGSTNNLDLFVRLDEFRRKGTLQEFYNLIDAMVEYGDLDDSELVRIYFEKLAINHKRVQGGYTEGTYQKHDENGEEDNRSIKV